MLAHWARCTHKFFGFSCQNGALLKCSGAVALSCVVERDADSPRSKKAKGVCALPARNGVYQYVPLFSRCFPASPRND